jgi:ketosteroid isomerase-like protein
MENTHLDSLIEDYYKALEAMDWDGWVTLFATEAVRHDVGQTPVGQEELKQFISGLGSLFETLNIHADSIYPTNHGTAVKWVASGVGKNGQSVEFSGIDVFKISASGKIEELFVYWDPAPIVSKLSK